MGPIYEHRHRVLESELDNLGHANNAAYFVWMQDAAVAHSRAVGLEEAEYERTGTTWVVRRHEIEYYRPAYVGEGLVIKTWVQTLQRITSLRRYEIQPEGPGKILARAATQWVFIDRRSGRPTRIPADVRDRFLIEPRETLGEILLGRQASEDLAPERSTRSTKR